MTRTLLHNLRIIDPFGEREFLDRGAILIEDDRIKFVGRGFSHVGFAGQLLDMHGKTVLPGMINAHTHLYSTLARGMPAPVKPPQNFVEILEQVWWKLDRGLDQAAVQASFEAGLLDSLKHGVTTVIDHHASPLYVQGSLDKLVEVAEKLGMTVSICFEISDRNGPENFQAELAENMRAISKYAHATHVAPLLGLHASFTLSDASLATLREALAAVGKAGIHIHVAEDLADEKDAQAKGYQSVIQRLDHFELLNDQTLIVHGIYMCREDRQTLIHRGCKLIHNPSSNANNRVGLLEQEIIETLHAGLGTDGMQNDLVAEAREGMLIRSGTGGPPVDYLKLLFKHNPDIAVGVFGQLLGHIEEDAQADLVFYDYESRTELQADNFGSHLLYGLGQPSDVMTRGIFRVRDGVVSGLDEKAVLENARKQSVRLWSAMRNIGK